MMMMVVKFVKKLVINADKTGLIRYNYN